MNAGIGTLEFYNWIGDLSNILDAPFDNLVNTNWFPLPQVGATEGGLSWGGGGRGFRVGGWVRIGEAKAVRR